MKALPVTKSVGWTRVDAKPLKKALEVLVSKWSYLYIKYLQARAICDSAILLHGTDAAATRKSIAAILHPSGPLSC
jgi:hypothetical protein